MSVIGRKVSYYIFRKDCQIIIVSVFKVWIAFLLVFKVMSVLRIG